MNKIERAIYDTKLHINNLEEQNRILIAKISAYKDQLNVLENIKDDKSIPHHELFDKPVNANK